MKTFASNVDGSRRYRSFRRIVKRAGFFLGFAMVAGVAAGAPATVELRGDVLQATGVTLAPASAAALWRAVPGPTSEMQGFMAAGAPWAIRGELAAPLQGPGSLSFWFRPDRPFRSGRGVAAFAQKLVELPGVVSVSFKSDATSVMLIAEWGGPKDEMFARHIRIILPEFPDPAWHHFAVYWDGAAGNVNAFLDGTPYYVPGEKVAALPIFRGREVVVHVGAFALAGVRIDSKVPGAADLKSAVGDAYWGRLDDLLGAKDLGPLAADRRRGAVLYARELAQPADIRDWRLEGPGDVAFRDGWMEMKSQRPDGPQGHVVHWCPQDFPGRFMAEWDFELLGEKGLCILFFAATGHGGRDLFDGSLKPRNGVFEQYTNGDIDCYHISYFANTPNEPRRVANLRKNSGFFLIANGPVGVPLARLGEPHRALLIKDGAQIQMAVDGRRIIDYIDDGQRAGAVHAGGKIGFRQMQWTSARYRNFRVFGLK